MMPEDGLDILRGFDAIFLGAVGWPAKVPDAVSLHGLLLPIRKAFAQYANIRPHRLLPGVQSPLRNDGFDILCIRENTEGEYSGAFGRGQTIYDPWHYIPVLARKPGALRNGAPFKDWVLPPAMTAIRRKLKGSDDGDRQMVEILALVPDDGLQAVEAACREALDQGVHSAPVIINIAPEGSQPALYLLPPGAVDAGTPTGLDREIAYALAPYERSGQLRFGTLDGSAVANAPRLSVLKGVGADASVDAFYASQDAAAALAGPLEGVSLCFGMQF